jgi:general secretion pathway protein K
MVMAPIAKYRRGVALLATMLAIALMTLLVADLTTSAGLGYRGAANRADQLRAYYLARSGVQVGLAMLERSAIASALQDSRAAQGAGGGQAGPAAGAGHDSLDQSWARPAAPVMVDDGQVTTFIVDEERRVNINLWLDPKTHQPSHTWAPIIVRLLTNIGVSTDILPILTDWLDPDSIESDGGAEAHYYLGLIPPYEPRNGPIPTIYDLRMLKGMDDLTFLKLANCFTAVTKQRVNLNTAPPEVLAALAPELENDPSLVKEIVEGRVAEPFLKVTDLSNRVPGLPQGTSFQGLLTTQSSYFTITGQGDFAGARKRVYATFARGPMNQGAANQGAANQGAANQGAANQGPASEGAVPFSLLAWHED